jgi:hypothetical protein
MMVRQRPRSVRVDSTGWGFGLGWLVVGVHGRYRRVAQPESFQVNAVVGASKVRGGLAASGTGTRASTGAGRLRWVDRGSRPLHPPGLRAAGHHNRSAIRQEWHGLATA